MSGEKFNLSRCIIPHIARGITWMILLPSLYRYASAQPGAQRPQDSNGLDKSLDPSMLIVVFVVMILTFFFLAIVIFYVRYCSNSPANGDALPSRAAPVDFFRKRGLDPEVIGAFPTFIYSSVKDLEMGKGAVQCAVCLSEFEDDDKLRLVPKCDHVFHFDCIDAWLASHVTCPVCRAKLTTQSNETVQLNESINELNQNQNNSRSGLTEDEQSSSEAQVLEIADTSHLNRPQRLGVPEKFPRSHSTGSLVEAGVNAERCPLRFPEEVRKQFMNSGKLKRTASFNVVLAREGSSRKGGYRSGGGEGSSRGRNYEDRQGGRSDRWVFSMTPRFVWKKGSITIGSTNKVGGVE